MVSSSETEISLRVHQLRALEAGRGRDARSVAQIPLAGWRDIARRVAGQVVDDRVGLTAAGVTFYTVLAMFPAMVVVVSIYGLVTDPATITDHLTLVRGIMPPAAIELLGAELERITLSRNEGLGITAIVALVFALWSANGAVKAMFEAMNVAFGEREKRGFFRYTATTLMFTLGAMVVTLVVVNVIVLVPVAFEFFGLGDAGRIVAMALPSLLMFAVVLAAISALYRIGPSRRHPQWHWITTGSLVATVLVGVVSAAFSFYLANWGDYGATYGSLGAAIGLMMWIYLTSFVVILGAELNAEIEHQTARDTTIGPDRPLGGRGAVVADTVGERS